MKEERRFRIYCKTKDGTTWRSGDHSGEYTVQELENIKFNPKIIYELREVIMTKTEKAVEFKITTVTKVEIT